MAVNQELLRYRKANNLCPRDGRPNVTNRKLCEKCLKASAVKTEKYRQCKIDAKLCTNCGKYAPTASSRLCKICKDKASKYSHNTYVVRYSERKKNNKCIVCNCDISVDSISCMDCLEKQSARQRIIRDNNTYNNLCVQCGNSLDGLNGKRCKTCIDKRNEWYRGSTTQIKDKIRRDGHRDVVMKHYGGECAECGESRPLRLSIDHVNNDGNVHRKEINKYGSGFFKWLIDNDLPEGFQVLCHNCNIEKYLQRETI